MERFGRSMKSWADKGETIVPRKTVQELIEELAAGCPKDIFYSDIYRCVKSARLPQSVFQEICKALTEKGIWVHS